MSRKPSGTEINYIHVANAAKDGREALVALLGGGGIPKSAMCSTSDVYGEGWTPVHYLVRNSKDTEVAKITEALKLLKEFGVDFQAQGRIKTYNRYESYTLSEPMTATQMAKRENPFMVQIITEVDAPRGKFTKAAVRDVLGQQLAGTSADKTVGIF